MFIFFKLSCIGVMLSTSIKHVKSTKGNNLFWDEGRISFFVCAVLYLNALYHCIKFHSIFLS